ncbi:MAG: hypothetical protein FJY92_11205, partial [Candidatus Hydrogenedentes bacterium]|nr:hypothetical protein [Candidatus Hydrogenedentota bacterium]
MPASMCAAVFVAIVAADGGPDWITVSPTPSLDRAAVILPTTPVAPGREYLLAWEMRVEGEKAWRFRANFAGVTVRFNGAEEYTPASIEKQTSCWQTLDWQRAWMTIDPSPGTQSVDATMAIESKEGLPGRFRVRNVRLIDLGEPLPLRDGEGELRVSVVDGNGKDTPARVYIVDASGNGVVPPYTYAYTQGTRCFELIDPRLARLALPAGRYTVRAMKGFEHAIASETVEVRAGQRHAVVLAMRKKFDQWMEQWRSTDH